MQACATQLSLVAIWLGVAATFLLALLGVRGVKVNRDGSISMGWSRPPPSDPKARARWAFPRFWLYRLGMPLGLFLFVASCAVQWFALYAPGCQ